MADLLFESFAAETPPGGWTDTTNGAGSISDAGATMSLTGGTLSADWARRRSPVVNMAADGDTITVQVVSASAFGSLIVLRQNTDDAAFQFAIVAFGSNWNTQIYRDATGYGSTAASTTLRSIASHPWLRWRRVSATVVAAEAAPDAGGTPGTWVLIGNCDAPAELVGSFSFATTQLELLYRVVDGGAPGSLVIEQVGIAGVSAPTIASIAPTSGPVGTEVTMTGTNHTGATVARHGDTVAMTGLVVDSPTQSRATIAAGSPASGTIRLTTPGGTAIGPTFTITPIFTSLEVTNPNTSYVLGELLDPITVRALDQFGNTFLGTLAPCEVSALTLPVVVAGTLSESFVAGIATFDNLTPVESTGAPVEVITVATPLRCTVDLFPRTSAALEASAGGAIPTLIARSATDHILRVTDIAHALTGVPVEPDRIRYELRDGTGIVVTGSVLTPTNPDDWQIALSRAAFTPARGPMVLTLTLVATGDSTETALQFVVVQGVRQ